MGEGWSRGGLITSFNIYISHVKKFTSKIKKNHDGFKIPGNLFVVFFSSLYLGNFFQNGPPYATSNYRQHTGSTRRLSHLHTRLPTTRLTGASLPSYHWSTAACPLSTSSTKRHDPAPQPVWPDGGGLRWRHAPLHTHAPSYTHAPVNRHAHLKASGIPAPLAAWGMHQCQRDLV